MCVQKCVWHAKRIAVAVCNRQKDLKILKMSFDKLISAVGVNLVCAGTLCLFSVLLLLLCCFPIICAIFRGIAPTPPIPSHHPYLRPYPRPVPDHSPAARVHRRRHQIIGRQPSEGGSAMLLSQFGVQRCLFWFNRSRSPSAMPPTELAKS